MASWIIHLRVAEVLYKREHINNINDFIMGNIAPDSGIPTANGRDYIPSAEVSHFRTLDSLGIKNVHVDLFIDQYLTSAQITQYPAEQYAFLLGYLTHLITDQLWVKHIVYNAVNQYSSLFNTDKTAFWRKIKSDWYSLDFQYLIENPDFEAYQIYANMTSYQNHYLDFFPETAIDERKQYIIDFYKKGVRNHDSSIETYISMDELDQFIETAYLYIIEHYSGYFQKLMEINK